MRIVKIFFILFITIIYSFAMPQISHSKEYVLYSFEKDPQGWEIPDWTFAKKDHIGKQIGISEHQASEGMYALEIDSEFTGGPGWECTYIECVVDITDWSPFSYVSADIFLPKEAPRGLRAKIILTVGDNWRWTEMNKTVPLAPGEWTVVKADITSASLNWRRFIDDAFRSDVRKIGIRIESNGKIAYKGPIYIDNVKLSE